jgi:NAD(P)-dependent dehydrogenase (short-subunit alcohol dehydrogenase family)
MGEELNGKVALVTGASSGIGRATAVRFAEEGAQVVIVGRDRAALSATAAEISRGGGEAFAVVADVTDERDAERIVRETIDDFERLDVLVNAAGILANGTIETTSLAAWDEMLDVNLRAVFHLMSLAVPHLEGTGGNIVNVSSVTGLRSFPGVLAYCVSKAGVDQLTRCAEEDQGQRREPRRRRHAGAQARRDGRREVRVIPRTLEDDAPARTGRRGARGRGADPLSRLRARVVDHGRDLLD